MRYMWVKKKRARRRRALVAVSAYARTDPLDVHTRLPRALAAMVMEVVVHAPDLHVRNHNAFQNFRKSRPVFAGCVKTPASRKTAVTVQTAE